MTRQINLFSPALRPKALLFSANWTLAAALITAAAMAGYYAMASFRLAELKSRRNANEGQLKQLREQLAGMGQAVQKTRSRALEEQLERAEALAGLQQNLVEKLKGGEFGNREGYAEFLTALARQRVEGVWLTRIEAGGAGGEFVIEGRALRADLVPGYIRLLRNEAALRGRPIGTLALRERELDTAGAPPTGAPRTPAPGPKTRVVEFTIGTGVGAVARGER